MYVLLHWVIRAMQGQGPRKLELILLRRMRTMVQCSLSLSPRYMRFRVNVSFLPVQDAADQRMSVDCTNDPRWHINGTSLHFRDAPGRGVLNLMPRALSLGNVVIDVNFCQGPCNASVGLPRVCVCVCASGCADVGVYLVALENQAIGPIDMASRPCCSVRAPCTCNMSTYMCWYPTTYTQSVSFVWINTGQQIFLMMTRGVLLGSYDIGVD